MLLVLKKWYGLLVLDSRFWSPGACLLVLVSLVWSLVLVSWFWSPCSGLLVLVSCLVVYCGYEVQCSSCLDTCVTKATM